MHHYTFVKRCGLRSDGADTTTPVHCVHLIPPRRTSESNYIRDNTPALPQALYSTWNKQSVTVLERRGDTVRRKVQELQQWWGEQGDDVRLKRAKPKYIRISNALLLPKLATFISWCSFEEKNETILNYRMRELWRCDMMRLWRTWTLQRFEYTAQYLSLMLERVSLGFNVVSEAWTQVTFPLV